MAHRDVSDVLASQPRSRLWTACRSRCCRREAAVATLTFGLADLRSLADQVDGRFDVDPLLVVSGDAVLAHPDGAVLHAAIFGVGHAAGEEVRAGRMTIAGATEALRETALRICAVRAPASCWRT